MRTTPRPAVVVVFLSVVLILVISLSWSSIESPPATSVPPPYDPPAIANIPDASPPTRSTAPGVDVDAGGFGSALAEVLIDVDPLNEDHLVICGHHYFLNYLATFCSFDRGQTWRSVLVGDANDHLGNATRFDPAVAFDAHGSIYVAYGIGYFVGGSERTSLAVCKSTDGGLTYGQAVFVGAPAPRVINVPGHDKWVLATGRDPFIPLQENVYIAWTWNIPTPAGNVDQQIAMSRSTDSGATFSPPLIINDDSIAGRDGGLVADPSVGPNGEVYVSWNDIQLTDAAIMVDRSLDGGVTWGTDVLASNPTMAWRTPITPQPDRGVGAAPVMDVDRSGGPYSGRGYIVYVQPGANGLDILLRYSDDQAQTWSAPVRVNDDATANDQFLPWISVGRNHGVVGVVFYDTREDPLNRLARTFAAISRNGGASFEPNLPVADVQSNNSTSNPNRYLGNYLEYIGVAVGNEAVHMVWTDTRWQWPFLNPGDTRYYYDSIVIEPTVPVLFAAFDAVWSNAHVEVTWELQGDEAMDEFLIYRGVGTASPVEIARRSLVEVSGSFIDAAVEPGKIYRYEMMVRTVDGDEFRSRVATVATPATGLALGQNHPNPFNPRTTIPYSVPASAYPLHVKLVVLDVAGRLVRTLVDEEKVGGVFNADWQGIDDSGDMVSSGVYLYVLDVAGERRAGKMVLLK